MSVESMTSYSATINNLPIPDDLVVVKATTTTTAAADDADGGTWRETKMRKDVRRPGSRPTTRPALHTYTSID